MDGATAVVEAAGVKILSDQVHIIGLVNIHSFSGTAKVKFYLLFNSHY